MKLQLLSFFVSWSFASAETIRGVESADEIGLHHAKSTRIIGGSTVSSTTAQHVINHYLWNILLRSSRHLTGSILTFSCLHNGSKSFKSLSSFDRQALVDIHIQSPFKIGMATFAVVLLLPKTSFLPLLTAPVATTTLSSVKPIY